jgi:hypothetical protein
VVESERHAGHVGESTAGMIDRPFKRQPVQGHVLRDRWDRDREPAVPEPILNEFCTLFDANYLPRGIVLYRSLADVCRDFRLRVFCMDAETKDVLDALRLPGVTAVGIDELEAADPDLRAIKPTRTQLEYCWTATPAVCLYSLEREPKLSRVTYLDADLMFFADPARLLEEAANYDALITPHRHAPQFRHWEKTSGTFNVQFVSFRNSRAGLETLRWWRDRCLEWCYNRFEDGRFGDQKYLDEWPSRFSGVHVVANPGAGLAPWNVGGHRLTSSDGVCLVDGLPLVFYHYHSLITYRLTRSTRWLKALPGFGGEEGPVPFVWSTAFSISPLEKTLVWDPYLARLSQAMDDLSALGVADPWLNDLRLQAVAEAAARHIAPAAGRRALSQMRRRFGGFGPRSHG